MLAKLESGLAFFYTETQQDETSVDYKEGSDCTGRQLVKTTNLNFHFLTQRRMKTGLLKSSELLPSYQRLDRCTTETAL